MNNRKIGFLFFIFCSISISLFAQIKVIYDVEFLNVTDDKEAQSSSYFKNVVNPMLDIFKRSNGVLEICEEKSYFSIISENTQVHESNLLADAYIGMSQWITTKSRSLNIHPRKGLLIVPDYNLQPWQITKETKIIAGYKCLKATKMLVFKGDNQKNVERVCQVWFSPEVSVSSGFMDATGLPGIILSYNDEIWNFNATSIETKKKCEIIIPDFEEISYSKSLQKLNKNIKSRSK